jgi:hypothetical protein
MRSVRRYLVGSVLRHLCRTRHVCPFDCRRCIKAALPLTMIIRSLIGR